MSMRDDFKATVKKTLAERVSNRCSNPYCGAPTSGPHTEPMKSINLGEAAHITAAAPGGPRYDASLTPEQRCSIENGLWLCRTCAHLVDADDSKYTVDELKQWKEQAEARAEAEAGKAVMPSDNAPAQEELTKNEQVFVAPSQWDEAWQILDTKKILVLTGPPHVGKSATALALLIRAVRERQLGHIQVFRQLQELNQISRLNGHAILLDDPFGGSRFDQPALADQFDELLRLAGSNYIVVTTRRDVLEQACNSRCIGASGCLDDVLVTLAQEGAYTDNDLKMILEKHVRYMRELQPCQPGRISAAQADILLSGADQIVTQLRFPHNIERLIAWHSSALISDADLPSAIEKARDIKRQAGIWYTNLPDPIRLFVLCLITFPGRDQASAETLYHEACEECGLKPEGSRALLRQAGGYLDLDRIWDLAHSSYEEGILPELVDRDLDWAWYIIRRRASDTDNHTLLDLVQCARAYDRLGLATRTGTSVELGTTVQTWQEYFEQFVDTYNRIIATDLSALRSAFLPGGEFTAGIHVSTTEAGFPSTWTFARRLPDQKVVSSSVGADTTFSFRRSEFQQTVGEETGQQNFVWSQVPDITRAIPHIDALESVLKQLAYMADKHKFIEWQNLSETWQMVHERVWRQLKDIGFPVDGITPENKLSLRHLREWAVHSILTFTGSQFAWADELTDPDAWPDVAFHGIRSNVPLRRLVHDVHYLEQEDHSITGPLLIPPDRDIRNPSWHPGRMRRSDAYSDTRLREAVEHALKLRFETYRAMVKHNFPTICDYFPRYRLLPVRAICVIDRRRSPGGKHPFVELEIIPQVLNVSSGTAVSVELQLIPENAPETVCTAVEQVRDQFRRVNRTDGWAEGFDLGLLIDSQAWRDKVYDMIRRDLGVLATRLKSLWRAPDDLAIYDNR